jgi:hypothetical protein
MGRGYLYLPARCPPPPPAAFGRPHPASSRAHPAHQSQSPELSHIKGDAHGKCRGS